MSATATLARGPRPEGGDIDIGGLCAALTTPRAGDRDAHRADGRLSLTILPQLGIPGEATDQVDVVHLDSFAPTTHREAGVILDAASEDAVRRHHRVQSKRSGRGSGGAETRAAQADEQSLRKGVLK